MGQRILCDRHGSDDAILLREQGASFYEEGNETLDQGEQPKLVTLDAAYLEANGPIIREQLKKAGVRLAHVLDQALTD
jgi:hypothetical protein